MNSNNVLEVYKTSIQANFLAFFFVDSTVKSQIINGGVRVP